MSEEEKKIDNLYYQIGKTYFETNRDYPEDNLAGYISAILEAMNTIEQYKEQIKETKGVTNCPNCGAEVPYTSSFCNACGTKMPQVQSFQTPEIWLDVIIVAILFLMDINSALLAEMLSGFLQLKNLKKSSLKTAEFALIAVRK